MARQTITLSLGLIAAVSSAGMAQAQLWPMRTQARGLTQGDIDAGKEATKPLFTDAATPGQSLAWSNPDTGNSGYTTYEKPLRIKGLACRAMRYEVDLTKPARKRSFSVNWCQTKDGWKVV